MDLSPGALLQRFRGKALRYVSVSVFGTVSTQLLLWFTQKLEPAFSRVELLREPQG